LALVGQEKPKEALALVQTVAVPRLAQLLRQVVVAEAQLGVVVGSPE
jgi:hypothetical protein